MAKIGALNVALGLQTAQFSAGVKKAQADVGTLQRSFSGLKAAAGGMLAGLGVGALVSAGRAALQYADDLATAADQAGISVERYQTLREALRTLELSTDQTDKVLKTLQATLGDVQSGADNSATKALDRLGISAKIMSGQITDSGQLLDALAASASKAGSQAQFTSDLVDVFGKKVGVDLAAALKDGGKSLHQFEADFLATGRVIDEAMIQKLAAANEAIDNFTTQSSNQFVIWAATVISAIERVGYVADRIGYVLANLSPFGKPETFAAGIKAYETAAAVSTAKAVAGMLGIKVGGGEKPLPIARPKAVKAGGGGTAKPTGGGGKTAEQIARDVERATQDRARAAKEAADNQRRYNAEEMQANADLISAQAALTQSTKQMAQAEFNQLNTRRQIDLAENAAREELNEGQKAVRARQIQEQFEADNALLAQRENADLAQEAARLQEIRNDAALAQIQLEVDGATTASERRAAELRLLDATIGLERARLEDIKATNASSSAAYKEAELRLQGLQTKRDVAATGIQRGTMGPLESYLATLPRTAAQANEALEALAANGISSIVDGLTDAAMGARSLGDVFKQVAKSIIADLLRIQIRKGVASALGSLIPGFGGFGGGGGIGIPSGGRALGGPVLPGRTYRVGERGPEFLTMGAKGHVIPDNEGARQAVQVHVEPSKYFDVRVEQISGSVVGRAAPAIVNASTQATMRAATRTRL